MRQEMLDMAVHLGHLLEGTELRSHTQRKAWFLKVWYANLTEILHSLLTGAAQNPNRDEG